MGAQRAPTRKRLEPPTAQAMDDTIHASHLMSMRSVKEDIARTRCLHWFSMEVMPEQTRTSHT